MSKVCWQKKIVLVILFLNLIFVPASAQLTTQQKSYTHADTLRGSITPLIHAKYFLFLLAKK